MLRTVRKCTYDPNRAELWSARDGRAWTNTQTAAPRAAYVPTVNNAIANGTNSGYQSYMNSLAPNPMNKNVSGGRSSPKPFQDYQRPTGYSPWMNLYTTPTNGGTVSPYTNSVQPQIQQQQNNAQMAEQIRGVQSNQYRLMSGVGGTTEQDIGGAGGGMTNPNAYLNVGGTYQGGR